MLFSQSRSLVQRILGRWISLAARRASSTSASTVASPTDIGVVSVGPADVKVFPLEEVPSKTSFERRLAWVENMDTVEARRLGLVELHPEIFVAHPKIHLIHDNVMWQMKYQEVNYESARTRAEMPGGGRKPWPQKGMGKARHGSIRSPLWKGGGIAHGPRGPRTYFYMLSGQQRAAGLCATLSVKLAQGDLHVVDSLETLASGSGEQLEQLVTARSWQHSVLFVDRDDVFPENAVRATDAVPHFNLMPVYGLNVFSMLKHDTLVLTVPAVNRLQQRLLAFMRKPPQHVPSLKDPSFFI